MPWFGCFFKSTGIGFCASKVAKWPSSISECAVNEIKEYKILFKAKEKNNKNFPGGKEQEEGLFRLIYYLWCLQSPEV
jgi:hypothetical protein